MGGKNTKLETHTEWDNHATLDQSSRMPDGARISQISQKYENNIKSLIQNLQPESTEAEFTELLNNTSYNTKYQNMLSDTSPMVDKPPPIDGFTDSPFLSPVKYANLLNTHTYDNVQYGGAKKSKASKPSNKNQSKSKKQQPKSKKTRVKEVTPESAKTTDEDDENKSPDDDDENKSPDDDDENKSTEDDDENKTTEDDENKTTEDDDENKTTEDDDENKTTEGDEGANDDNSNEEEVNEATSTEHSSKGSNNSDNPFLKNEESNKDTPVSDDEKSTNNHNTHKTNYQENTTESVHTSQINMLDDSY
jgi:hypothetical protein